MAAASLLTVFLSLFQDCPGSLFYGLELGINLVLIAEVGIRMGAFGKVSLPFLFFPQESSKVTGF